MGHTSQIPASGSHTQPRTTAQFQRQTNEGTPQSGAMSMSHTTPQTLTPSALYGALERGCAEEALTCTRHLTLWVREGRGGAAGRRPAMPLVTSLQSLSLRDM